MSNNVSKRASLTFGLFYDQNKVLEMLRSEKSVKIVALHNDFVFVLENFFSKSKQILRDPRSTNRVTL